MLTTWCILIMSISSISQFFLVITISCLTYHYKDQAVYNIYICIFVKLSEHTVLLFSPVNHIYSANLPFMWAVAWPRSICNGGQLSNGSGNKSAKVISKVFYVYILKYFKTIWQLNWTIETIMNGCSGQRTLFSSALVSCIT